MLFGIGQTFATCATRLRAGKLARAHLIGWQMEQQTDSKNIILI